MHIWRSPQWPNFTHDAARTEVAFAQRLGQVAGLQETLTATERCESFLRVLTREAVARFGIEGVALSAE